MRHTFIALVFLAALATNACNKDSTPQPSAESAPATANTASEKHAPSHAAPGSHEDWCEEHAVPESMCTRCNPSLIAAFKATGDWCEEHGLPESQCLICNPNLKIERPPKKGQ